MSFVVFIPSTHPFLIYFLLIINTLKSSAVKLGCKCSLIQPIKLFEMWARMAVKQVIHNQTPRAANRKREEKLYSHNYLECLEF